MFGSDCDSLHWFDSLYLLYYLGVLDPVMISHVFDHPSSEIDSKLTRTCETPRVYFTLGCDCQRERVPAGYLGNREMLSLEKADRDWLVSIEELYVGQRVNMVGQPSVFMDA